MGVLAPRRGISEGHLYAGLTHTVGGINGVMTGDRTSFVLLSEFPLPEKPRQVIVSLDDQHSVRETLVWQTHPYPEHGLATTGK